MLKPRKRLTKREIKEDPLVTKYIQVKQFWLNHSKEFSIIFGVITVVVIVGFLMMRSKKSAEIKANSKLVIPEMYYHFNNYEQSMPELKTIIDQYPGTHSAGMAVFFLANAYYYQGEYDEAILCYTRAINLDPQHELAYNNLGVVYYKKQNDEKALENFKNAIAINSNFAEPYNNIGVIYYNQGKLQLAKDYFKKSCELGYEAACNFLNALK